MDLREALYTTRAMRRVDADRPIPQEVQARILDAAVRAPSGGNSQNWKFLLVDDKDVMAKIGPIYREGMAWLWANYYKAQVDAAAADPDSEASKQFVRVQKSAQHLADHFEEYPLLLFGFSQHDPSGGSIYPAVWNAMLAARGEGVGAALTSLLGLRKDDVFPILGVPAEGGWHMACCVTFGYPTGRWGVATRAPVETVSYRNQWGTPLDFEVNGPLWP